MVEILLVLILLVLLFGATRVLSWGIVAAVVVVGLVVALLAGFFALDWLRTSSHEIPRVLGFIVCALLGFGGVAIALDTDYGLVGKLYGPSLAAIAIAALVASDTVSWWAWFFMLAAAVAAFFGSDRALQYAWYLPGLRDLPQPPKRVARVYFLFACISLAAAIAGTYGGYVAALWLREWGVIAPAP